VLVLVFVDGDADHTILIILLAGIYQFEGVAGLIMVLMSFRRMNWTNLLRLHE